MNYEKFYKQCGIKDFRALDNPKSIDTSNIQPMTGMVWHQLSPDISAQPPAKWLYSKKKIEGHIAINLLAPTEAELLEHPRTRAAPTVSSKFRNEYLRTFVKGDRDASKAFNPATISAVQRDSPGIHYMYCHESTKLCFGPTTNTQKLSAAAYMQLESAVIHASNDAIATGRHQTFIIDLPESLPDANRIRSLGRLTEHLRFTEADTHGLSSLWVIEMAMAIIGHPSVFDYYKGSARLLEFMFIDEYDLSTSVSWGMLLDQFKDIGTDPIKGTGVLVPTSRKTDQVVMKSLLAMLSASIGVNDSYVAPTSELLAAEVEASADEPDSHDDDDDDAAASALDAGVRTALDTGVEVSDQPEYLQDLVVAAATGNATKASLRAAMALSNSVDQVASPWGGQALRDFAVTDPSVLKITDADSDLGLDTKDKSYHSTTLKSFDSKYVREVLHRDIASCFVGLEGAGIYVQAITSEVVRDAGKSVETLEVKLKPVDGQPSVLRPEIPVISEEGVMYSNGSKRRMKKQWTDIPIKKTKFDEVMISAAPGKLFINRVRLKAKNESEKLKSIISRFAIKNPELIKFRSRVVFDASESRPSTLESLALHFESISFNGYNLNFKSDQSLGEDVVARLDKLKLWCAGTHRQSIIAVDMDNTFHLVGDEVTEIGSLYDILDFIDYAKIPSEFAEMRLLGKRVPMAMVLLRYFGLTELIGIIGDPVSITDIKNREQLRPDQCQVVTRDASIVMPRNSTIALVLSGLTELPEFVKKSSGLQFEDTNYNGAMLYGLGLLARHENQLLTMRDIFIDPMTARRLAGMGKPTKLKLLLIEAVSMLRTRKSRPPTHSDGFLLKGYERVPSILYKSLYGSVRDYNNLKHLKRKSLKLNPKEVWMAIMTDKTVSLVNEGNPIHALKEASAYTLIGDGGRSKEAIVEKDREIHPSSIGMISEASVDSGDAGVSRYLPFSPTIKTLDGTHGDWSNTGTGSIFSIGAAVAPFSNRDHPPRTMFSGVQQSHIIPIAGSKQSIIRTGAEAAVVASSGPTFIKRATGPGVVTSVGTEVVIKYDNGDTAKLSTSTKVSVTSSLLLPRKMGTILKVGDKVDVGTPTVFCTDYFEEDWIRPGELTEKRGVLARTALLEVIETEDDSSLISSEFSELMETEISIERVAIIPFSQSLINVLKIGDSVESDTIIYSMEGYSVGEMSSADAKAFSDIEKLNSKAEFRGVITDIRCVYNGNIDDMSDSLKAIAVKADARLSDLYKEGEANWMNGSVGGDYMSKGDNLVEQTMELKFIIAGPIDASSGDKLIIGNQSKSVACDARTTKIWTASDRKPIDASYSASGIQRRNIRSAILMGSTNTVCIMLARHAVEKYKESK